MKKLDLFIVVIVLVAQLCICGHDHKYHASVPAVVDRSEKARECPIGFNWLGKECIQEIASPLESRCPPGFSRIADEDHYNGNMQCVRYSGKIATCPAGFVRHEGVCKVIHEVQAEIFCPADFAFTADSHQCMRNVPLPAILFCLNDSRLRDGHCVISKNVIPQLICPPGFLLEGKRCFIEETYDCTKDEQIISSDRHYHKNHNNNNGPKRALGASTKHKSKYDNAEAILPAKRSLPPTVIEHVVQKTCKRTRSEDAKKLCPPKSSLLGKECRFEELIPALTKPGGFKEEFAQPLLRCPNGFAPGLSHGKCSQEEETLPEFHCPSGTQVLGEKCAVFQQSHHFCPAGFKLSDKNNNCMKVIRAPPLVEYTVTYACKGKDCENNLLETHHQKSGH